MTNGANGAAATTEYAAWPGNFTFEVEFDQGGGPQKKLIGSFREVSGLGAQVDVEEHIEGGTNGYIHKLPGRVTWPNIVLKRGVTRSNTLFEWFATASDNGMASPDSPDPLGIGPPSPAGKLIRGHATLSLWDQAGEVVHRWNLRKAFPVRWAGPTLAASTADVAVEELEVAHHGFGTTS